MKLSASPRCLPSLPGLRSPFVPTSSLLLLHLSSHPIPSRSLSASPTPKSNLGWGRPSGRSLRARPSDEETSTAVVDDDAASKRVEGPFFLMRSSSAEEDAPAYDLLSKLNLKLDSEDAYTILFYGAGALVALWISAAIVSSIDSLPVFPKVMELVGLGFTVWFSSRYLIFKENREELFRKLDDLKEKIVGPGDN